MLLYMMQAIILNYRFWILSVLFAISIVCIISEATAEKLSTWLLVMVVSKLVGVSLAWVTIRLFKYWERKGKIDELVKLIGE